MQLSDYIKLEQPKINILSELKNENNKLVIYGAGMLGATALKFMKENNIHIDAICVDHKFYSNGMKINEYVVCDVEEMEWIYPTTVIVAMKNLKLGIVLKEKFSMIKRIIFWPTNMTVIDGYMTLEYFLKYKKEFQNIFEILNDDKSRKSFIAWINSNILSSPQEIFDICEDGGSFFDSSVLNKFDVSKDKIFLDIGSYRGETIQDYLKYNPGVEMVYAIEGDRILATDTEKTLSNIMRPGRYKVFNRILSDKKKNVCYKSNGTFAGSYTYCVKPENDDLNEINVSIALDDLIGHVKIDTIKLNTSGICSDLILNGGRNLISKFHPKIVIKQCTYGSFLNTMSFLFSMGYKVYCRFIAARPEEFTIYSIFEGNYNFEK